MQEVGSKVAKLAQSGLEARALTRSQDTTNSSAAGLGKVLAVSPHLDDAVLGCGDVLALNPGACVLTVFAGAPQDPELTQWDRLAGFRCAGEVIPIRKEEDALALFLLEAYPVWLGFLEAQYTARPAVQEVADALQAAIAQQAPDHVLFPLGLFHEDHRLTSEAMLRVSRTLPNVQRWMLYADALHRELSGEVERRLEELRAGGWQVDLLAPVARQAAKRRAVECYESQLRALATPGGVALERASGSEAHWTLAWHS